MPKDQKLPQVSEATLQRIIAEKMSGEDGLERGVQAELLGLFDAVLRDGSTKKLQEIEQEAEERKREWLRTLSREQPALHKYLSRLDLNSMTTLFISMLETVGVDRESARSIGKSLGRVASDQIYDMALTFYYCLHAEVEGKELEGLWEDPSSLN